MRSQVLNEKEWVSLKEASKITGKSVHALQLMISRGKLEKVRKQGSNGHGYWEIHNEVLKSMMDEKLISQGVSHENFSDISQVVTMPTEAFFQQQKERDNLLQGLMMYRYKFEELDRQIKMLPAPLEVLPAILQEKDVKLSELEQKAELLEEVERKLLTEQQSRERIEQELQKVKEDLLNERSLSWWSRLWKKRS